MIDPAPGFASLGVAPVLVQRAADLGFADELGQVLARLSRRRQTLPFAATMPEGVATLADRGLHDAQRIEAAPAGIGSAGTTPPRHERALRVEPARRTPLLRGLITTERWPRTPVFVASKHASAHVADKLRQAGIAAATLHGGLSAGRRQQVLAERNDKGRLPRGSHPRHPGPRSPGLRLLTAA